MDIEIEEMHKHRNENALSDRILLNVITQDQSYEIKSPPWTILWFRILGIFSVKIIDRLGVLCFKFETIVSSALIHSTLLSN